MIRIRIPYFQFCYPLKGSCFFSGSQWCDAWMNINLEHSLQKGKCLRNSAKRFHTTWRQSWCSEERDFAAGCLSFTCFTTKLSISLHQLLNLVFQYTFHLHNLILLLPLTVLVDSLISLLFWWQKSCINVIHSKYHYQFNL